MEGGLLLFSFCMDLTAKSSSHCWIWMAPSMHHHCGAIIIYQTLSLEEGAVIESTIEANIEHG
jgi:hypothetical protein